MIQLPNLSKKDKSAKNLTATSFEKAKAYENNTPKCIFKGLKLKLIPFHKTIWNLPKNQPSIQKGRK